MAIDSQSLYVQLGRLAETVPKAAERRGASGLQWFGRAHALVAAFDRSEGEQLQSAIDNMISFESSEYAAKAMFIFYRVLAAAELQAPAAVQGSFIPAGNAFDALAVLSKVLSSATIECLIVDPYMDEKTLTDFAPLAHEGVSIRLLADEASYKPTLKPAAQRWISQYGKIRPMKAKIAPAANPT